MRLGVPLSRPGNENQPILEIQYEGRSMRMPVWVLPGTADDVVVVNFGHGRERAGRVGTRSGHDSFVLRTSQAPWFGAGVEVTRTSDTYFVASTQNHFVMEGRNPVRAVDARGVPPQPGGRGRDGRRASDPR